MAPGDIDLPDGVTAPHEDTSIGALFSRLIGDVERFARAEVRLYRAELLGRLDAVKFALAMGAVALLLAQATVVALLVGLLLILQPYIGAGWATVAVVGGALVLLALLGWFALQGVRKAFAGEPS